MDRRIVERKRPRALTANPRQRFWAQSPVRFVLLLLCLLAVDAQADASRQIHDLAVLVDPNGVETIDSVSRPDRADEFRALTRGFSAGYTRDVHWLRFTLHPPAPDDQGLRESLLLIYPPFLDDIRLYLPVAKAAGGFEERLGGDLRPFAEREYPYRSFAYTVVFTDDQPITAYLRLETTSSSWVAMYVRSPTQFAARVAIESLLLGTLFGLLLAGILSNLWHGLWREQRLYQSFLLYLLAAFLKLLSINGLTSPFVLPSNPELNHQLTSVTFLLLVAAMAWFYIQALSVNRAPILVRGVYYVTIAFALLSLPTPFLDLYPEAMRILIVLALMMLVLGAFRSLVLWWRAENPGGWLFIAHAFTLLGSIPTALLVGGWLPGDLVVHYGFQIGLFGSLTALQIMLALRTRAIERSQVELRLQAEQASSRAQSEHRRLEQQRQFMNMLTHELKTPLSVIQLRLQAPEPSARMQRLASDAVTDMNAIIDRCALSARVEEEALAVDCSAVDLRELIDELRTAWPGAGRLHVAVPEAPCSLHTDPRLLRVVFCNLIDNSLKYSPPGTPVHLAVAAQESRGVPGWQVTLTNPVEAGSQVELSRMFEKYYRGNSARRASGSGLGLYVVEGIVASLQGSVRFEREADTMRCALWLPTQVS